MLIVDDYADNREMYGEYLTFAGYRIATAENGADALAKVKGERPDVIVMDLTMPVMDGWEATRRLKADSGTRTIPVVALTGHALEGSDKGAREAGCDDFLAKPFLPQDLARVVDRWAKKPPPKPKK